MPRVIFQSLTQLKKWSEKFLSDPTRYVAYTTDLEAILKPVRNSRDYDYGYLRVTDGKDMVDVQNFLKDLSVDVFPVKRYEWAIDRQIGVKSMEVDD